MRKIILSLLFITSLYSFDYDKVPTNETCKNLLDSSKKYFDKSSLETDIELKYQFKELSKQYFNQHDRCMHGSSQRKHGEALVF